MSAIEYGSYYWCVILNQAGANGAAELVHLHADEANVENNGALTFKSAGRRSAGNALIAVQQAKSSYLAAVEARQLQEQALDVEQSRFEEGVGAEVTALGIYAKAKAALDRAVGTTLKNNNGYTRRQDCVPDHPPRFGALDRAYLVQLNANVSVEQVFREVGPQY